MANGQVSPQSSGFFLLNIYKAVIIPSYIEWLITWILIIYVLSNVASRRDFSIYQAVSSSVPLLLPDIVLDPTRYNGGAQGIRTLLFQVINLAYSLYIMRPVRRMRDRRARKISSELGGVEAQVQLRRLNRGQPHMYNDMQMNQNTGVAIIVTERRKNSGS